MSLKRARLEAAAEASSRDNLENEEWAATQLGAKKFRSFLIEKYLDGTTSAADTCLLAFFHGEAGGAGTEDLALGPSTASRHAAEHLRLQGVSKIIVVAPDYFYTGVVSYSVCVV